MTAVALRILSGVHLGAEIVLENGTWAFGRDDSCDIILSDGSLSARHCAVTAAEDGSVTFRALDGTVTTATDEDVPNGVLKPGLIYKMGAVLFAWGECNAPQTFWDGVAVSLMQLSQPRKAPNDAAESTKAESEDQTPEGDGAKEQTAAAAADGTAADEAGEGAKAQEGASGGSARWWLGTMSLILLVLLGIGAYLYAAHQVPRTDTPHESLWAEARDELKNISVERVKDVVGRFFEAEKPTSKADIRQRLGEAGFGGLTVEKAPSGAFHVTGSVKDDNERGRLVTFARGMKEHVFIDVTVDSDYTRAIESAFNTIDFWPAVTLQKKADHDELLVAAYMLSNVTEEKAFGEASKNVPFLTAQGEARPKTVTRRIRYQKDVEKLIGTVFREKAVDGVVAEYLPGRIKLTTTLTPERKEKLNEALALLRRRCDVPLQIDVVNKPVKTAPVVRQATAAAQSAKPDSRDPYKPTFRVVGVSGNAIKFVTLSNGEKVFEGGRLPGGFTLESISYDRLVLKKNNRKINYPLKVSK